MQTHGKNMRTRGNWIFYSNRIAKIFVPYLVILAATAGPALSQGRYRQCDLVERMVRGSRLDGCLDFGVPRSSTSSRRHGWGERAKFRAHIGYSQGLDKSGFPSACRTGFLLLSLRSRSLCRGFDRQMETGAWQDRGDTANAGGRQGVGSVSAEAANVPGKPSSPPGEQSARGDERGAVLRHHTCRVAGVKPLRRSRRSCPGSNPRGGFAGACRNPGDTSKSSGAVPSCGLDLTSAMTTRGNTDECQIQHTRTADLTFRGPQAADSTRERQVERRSSNHALARAPRLSEVRQQ